MIWRDGYRQGAYTAHVYDDAAAKLRAWQAAGHPLHVYSSGSVAAQRLFFGHSTAGDLSLLFSGWFDTETGAKREAASYRRIAGAIGRAPADILFLSDVVVELDAACEAGLATVLLDRRADYPEPRAPAPPPPRRVVHRDRPRLTRGRRPQRTGPADQSAPRQSMWREKPPTRVRG
jgi:enolase-phosphatase E1